MELTKATPALLARRIARIYIPQTLAPSIVLNARVNARIQDRDSNHATGDFFRYRAQLSADTLDITFRTYLRHA
jgi:hypothetical protein